MTDTHDCAESELIGSWLHGPPVPLLSRARALFPVGLRMGRAGRKTHPAPPGKMVSTPRVCLAQPPPSRARKNQSKERTVPLRCSGPQDPGRPLQLVSQVDSSKRAAPWATAVCGRLLRSGSSHRAHCAGGLGPFPPLERARHSQGRSVPAGLFTEKRNFAGPGSRTCTSTCQPGTGCLAKGSFREDRKHIY